MLVSNHRFGASLAEHFTNRASGGSTSSGTGNSNSNSSNNSHRNEPDHAVVLMRRHGFTTLGYDIPMAVYRAIYTAKNAAIQTQSILLRDAFASRPGPVRFMNDPHPLTLEQAKGCAEANERVQGRAWKLWCREVERNALYVNKA